MCKKKIFGAYYEYRVCRKGILFMVYDKAGILMFSALLWHTQKTVIVFHDYTETNGIFTFEMLGRILPYCLLKYNILTLHGVLMEYEGKGIVLSAPSGTGKSTHAHFWRDNYRRLLLMAIVLCLKRLMECGWDMECPGAAVPGNT